MTEEQGISWGLMTCWEELRSLMLLSAKHQEEKCYSIFFFPSPCMYKGQCHPVATPGELMCTALVNQIYLYICHQTQSGALQIPVCGKVLGTRQHNRKMTVLGSFSHTGQRD